jgi:hypothetical protein
LGSPAGVDLDGLKRENENLRKQIDKYKKLQEKEPHLESAKQSEK